MKNLIKFSFTFLLIIGAASCKNSPKGKKVHAEKAKEVTKSTAQELKVDLEKSHIKWFGTKPTGEHNGTVMLKDGYFAMKDGKVIGGKFKVDLTTIKNKDIEDADMKAKLEGHLKSEDFFHVEKYPTAVFEITGIEELSDMENMSHKISGNLTMKDSVKNISFMANVHIHDGHIMAESEEFKIDRTKWGVNYGSKKIFADLKDKFIHDEMGLIIKIEAGQHEEDHDTHEGHEH